MKQICNTAKYTRSTVLELTARPRDLIVLHRIRKKTAPLNKML